VSVHVRETGKGRRCDVKLRDRDGVMHTKTFRTKREAVDYEADQRAQLSAGTFIAPRASATTVEDLATRWLAAGTKRDSSRARDRSIVQTHLLPGLGPKRATGTVTRADCQALVDRWVAAGLAPRTVIRVAAALRSMFQYALDAELLARNRQPGSNSPTLGRACAATPSGSRIGTNRRPHERHWTCHAARRTLPPRVSTVPFGHCPRWRNPRRLCKPVHAQGAAGWASSPRGSPSGR
jgi:hypothetical protein